MVLVVHLRTSEVQAGGRSEVLCAVDACCKVETWLDLYSAPSNLNREEGLYNRHNTLVVKPNNDETIMPIPAGEAKGGVVRFYHVVL